MYHDTLADLPLIRNQSLSLQGLTISAWQSLRTYKVELHRLNITLSNYFDVAPDTINGITISAPTETMKASQSTRTEIIV